MVPIRPARPSSFSPATSSCAICALESGRVRHDLPLHGFDLFRVPPLFRFLALYIVAIQTAQGVAVKQLVG